MTSQNDRSNGQHNHADGDVISTAGNEFVDGDTNSLQSTSKRPYLNPNEEHEKMLETMDKLRSSGLENLRGNHSLPQIIVCGSQSSGKSSVLEAIAGIPFPQKGGGLCTSYKTRVTLLRTRQNEITLTIDPGPERKAEEVSELRRFKKTINVSSWDELQEPMRQHMDEATALIFKESKENEKYKNDTLCISIKGPHEQNLELLDLPGFIELDPWRGQNVQRVLNMVTAEMKKKHSIVLAVVEAGKDLLTHKVLQMCADMKIPSERTLGVLTMPDKATEEQAKSHVHVVQGKDDQFKETVPLKWHVLRNRNEQESKDKISLDQREVNEAEFFQTVDPWNQLSRNGPGITHYVKTTGIQALRIRLGDILFNMARKELPILYRNLQEQKTSLLTKLAELGGNLTEDQTTAAFEESVARLKKMSADHARGIYESDIRDELPSGPVHFRSRVMDQADAFRDKVIQMGHTWELESHKQALDPNSDLDSVNKTDMGSTKQKIVTKTEEEAVEFFVSLLRTMRTEELPVFHNDRVINKEFWLLSARWKDLAAEHIKAVFKCCTEYFEKVTPLAFSRAETVPSIIPREGFDNHTVVAERYQKQFLDPKLEMYKQEALQDLMYLEGDRLATCQNLDREFLAAFREKSNNSRTRRVIGLLENKENLNKKQEIGAADIAIAQSLHTAEDWAREHAEKLLNALWPH